MYCRIDTFDIEKRLPLGTLTKVRVGHDNTGIGPGWFLDKVIYYIYLEVVPSEPFPSDVRVLPERCPNVIRVSFEYCTSEDRVF